MIQNYWLLLGFCNVCLGLYFIVTTCYGLFQKEKSNKLIHTWSRFAILIPARNEATVIGYLLESLEKQNYPKEQYDVFILLNHCQDQTEEISKQNGAKVLLISDTVSSKGEVLNEAFTKFTTSSYDAYAIFDADNVVHPDFLLEMNQQLLQGEQVIQGFRDSKNATTNWLTASYSIFYWIQDFFYQSRANLQASAAINGTGFVIAKSYLKEYPYFVHTLTEDMEFSAQCALHQTRIAYAKKAITYDEQPTQLATLWKQRKRWTVGGYQCLKDYSFPLQKKFASFPMACMDSFLLFSPPYCK